MFFCAYSLAILLKLNIKIDIHKMINEIKDKESLDQIKAEIEEKFFNVNL